MDKIIKTTDCKHKKTCAVHNEQWYDVQELLSKSFLEQVFGIPHYDLCLKLSQWILGYPSNSQTNYKGRKKCAVHNAARISEQILSRAKLFFGILHNDLWPKSKSMDSGICQQVPDWSKDRKKCHHRVRKKCADIFAVNISLQDKKINIFRYKSVVLRKLVGLFCTE